MAHPPQIRDDERRATWQGAIAQVSGLSDKRTEDRQPSQGRRLPRGWRGARIGGEGNELRLQWAPSADGPAGAARLCITVALDVRANLLVDVVAGSSGDVLATFDIRYAYAFQVFEVHLSAVQAAAALGGVLLRSRITDPELWVFTETDRGADGQFFLPRLVAKAPRPGTADRRDAYLQRMTSLASLQPFGWLEGCVLDGIDTLRPVVGDARAERALTLHLDQYLDPDGRLVYEDLSGHAADDTFTTIEATLPAAVIARRTPEHPIIERVVAYLAGREHALAAGAMITAEGCYTSAYPLAVIGARLDRPALVDAAIDQLLIRRDVLANGRVLTPRTQPCPFGGMYRNWARGYAWYLLGMVRVAAEVRDLAVARFDEVTAEITRIAEVAVSWRLPGGLWSCYVDEPDTGVETSGSAGIAAALAVGSAAGLLPAEAAEVAASSLAALEARLSPDGLLGGVSQHNAGGEELQRGGYRVYSQMGMGLMAIGYGALAARR